MALADLIRKYQREENTKNTASSSGVLPDSLIDQDLDTKNTWNTTLHEYTDIAPEYSDIDMQTNQTEYPRYYLDSGWTAARDAWQKHYFQCPSCIRAHRSTKGQVVSTCEVGEDLHSQYHDISIAIQQ